MVVVTCVQTSVGILRQTVLWTGTSTGWQSLTERSENSVRQIGAPTSWWQATSGWWTGTERHCWKGTEWQTGLGAT